MNKLLIQNTLRNLNKIRPLYNKRLNYKHFSTTSKLFRKEYTDNEEWVNYDILNESNDVKIGLSEYAVEQLGEIVYVDFPYTIGDKIEHDDEIVFIESVKATDSIKAPFDGIIKDMNHALEEDLDTLNSDPENTNTSWLIKLDKLDA